MISRKEQKMALRITSVFHSDHSIDNTLLQWAVESINPTGFFLTTIAIPAEHAPLLNALYGPCCGDRCVEDSMVEMRSEDRPASRTIDLPKRPTRLLTVIGMAKGSEVQIYTAYGGPAAAREPNDPSIATVEEKESSKLFWSMHALSSQ